MAYTWGAVSYRTHEVDRNPLVVQVPARVRPGPIKDILRWQVCNHGFDLCLGQKTCHRDDLSKASLWVTQRPWSTTETTLKRVKHICTSPCPTPQPFPSRLHLPCHPIPERKKVSGVQCDRQNVLSSATCLLRLPSAVLLVGPQFCQVAELFWRLFWLFECGNNLETLFSCLSQLCHLAVAMNNTA